VDAVGLPGHIGHGASDDFFETLSHSVNGSHIDIDNGSDHETIGNVEGKDTDFIAVLPEGCNRPAAIGLVFALPLAGKISSPT
jgi:hypothetical protein